MTKELYRVRFVNDDKIYELYAKQVYQGDLYGFIVIEDIIFSDNQSIVVDPSEERLKDEFAGVTHTHIPMHRVIRIDQVAKAGVAKISADDSNIALFPSGMYNREQDNSSRD